MRVLIAGGTGLLGPYLAEAAERLGQVVVHGRSAGGLALDLTLAGAVRRLVDEVRPDIVLQCVALTDVDRCEQYPDAADALNRLVTHEFASALPREATLVQLSTDQVYPGLSGPYAEGDEAPVNAYGRSKLAGERAALAHPNGLVLRVNFFGPSRTPGRASLSDWLIDSLRHGSRITLFRDNLFSPLHLATLSSLVVEAVQQKLRGIFNLGARNGMSKADFAMGIARRLALSTERATVGRSTEVPGRASRPKDMRMAVDRIEQALGRAMPTLDHEIGLLSRDHVRATA